MSKPKRTSRRDFLKKSSLAAMAPLFPMIVPSTVFGAEAPSNKITVGCIGVGRMGSGDMRAAAEQRKYSRIVAVCDLDSKRVGKAQHAIDSFYKDAGGCAGYEDFRELLARDDIDAVTISTPDHWHSIAAVEAAKAGKDMYLQKPMGLTVEECRIVADAMKKHNRVFQMGSQQRSASNFRYACELVRNGRIGKIQHIEIGFGLDPCGLEQQEVMPVPKNLNYDLWLGQTPEKEYTERRVHPQADYGRPGWLRIRDYGAGMITGWGSHHLDIAHWGMGMEASGPDSIEGWGQFPEAPKDFWNVHGDFHLTYHYANGVDMQVGSNKRFKQGVKFIGEDGWIWVKRSEIDASNKKLLTSVIGPDEVHLYNVTHGNHIGNFMECVKSRAATVAPAENGHRSCSACLLGAITMELGRKVRWNPKTERFIDDPEADAKLTLPRRKPWDQYLKI